ncbi:hypothetical protein [Moorena sp. SIO4A5]|uniref:hypothetical protein n=1 Tax=Moorena sp. SIO4A5 TaxID=2607838 RepID=UPI0013CCD2CB|nr:hypothetical protein [Moorena sp. SIO4A5]NEO22242.1 hypothetical protein [Moorena sp. SIO4A5]
MGISSGHGLSRYSPITPTSGNFRTPANSREWTNIGEGLLPVMRRVWTQDGDQPIAQVKHQYQWLWVYAFVHPESGETYWWLLPKVNTQLFNPCISRFCPRISMGFE